MQIELTQKELRTLLDMVYIGNWVLNSTRGEDRFPIYDRLESKLFSIARDHGMQVLAQDWEGTVVPSQAYAEDNIFYEILAEELSRRDMNYPEITDDNYPEIISRMEGYMNEFEASGVDRLVLET